MQEEDSKDEEGGTEFTSGKDARENIFNFKSASILSPEAAFWKGSKTSPNNLGQRNRSDEGLSRDIFFF